MLLNFYIQSHFLHVLHTVLLETRFYFEKAHKKTLNSKTEVQAQVVRGGVLWVVYNPHPFPWALKPRAAPLNTDLQQPSISPSPSWRNFHSWLTWNDIIVVGHGCLLGTWMQRCFWPPVSFPPPPHTRSHTPLNRSGNRTGIKHCTEGAAPFATSLSSHRSHSGASALVHGSPWLNSSSS